MRAADLWFPDLGKVYVVGYRGRDTKWALIGPVFCARETGKAVLIRFEGAETWVPKSMCHPDENEIKSPGDEGMLVIPEWLAHEKGWL